MYSSATTFCTSYAGGHLRDLKGSYPGPRDMWTGVPLMLQRCPVYVRTMTCFLVLLTMMPCRLTTDHRTVFTHLHNYEGRRDIVKCHSGWQLQCRAWTVNCRSRYNVRTRLLLRTRSSGLYAGSNICWSYIFGDAWITTVKPVYKF